LENAVCCSAILLGPHVFKLAVVAAVAHQLASVDVQGHVGHRIQKFPVVADDHHGAFVLLEPGFQPDQSVQVQVVGGFVQQQQIAGAHQRPASCRRMRQPPEKLLTGFSSSLV
jgi:hypothetical protein